MHKGETPDEKVTKVCFIAYQWNSQSRYHRSSRFKMITVALIVGDQRCEKSGEKLTARIKELGGKDYKNMLEVYLLMWMVVNYEV